MADYNRQEDALHAGREPRPNVEALTVKELVNAFLIAKREAVDVGALSPRTHTGYSHAALSDLAKLPLPFQQYVENEVGRLAGDPFRLGRKAVFPFPPRGQVFHPNSLTLDGDVHWFVILFVFGEDENTRIVTGVGHHVQAE